MLEVVRLEGHSLAQEDAFMSRDVHLLQVCLLVLEVSPSFIVKSQYLKGLLSRRAPRPIFLNACYRFKKSSFKKSCFY